MYIVRLPYCPPHSRHHAQPPSGGSQAPAGGGGKDQEDSHPGRGRREVHSGQGYAHRLSRHQVSSYLLVPYSLTQISDIMKT